MKNEKSNNEFAYPAIFDLTHKETFATYQGLTKLELISAMCLQGLLANTNRDSYDKMNDALMAIYSAKELLKQLEADNE